MQIYLRVRRTRSNNAIWYTVWVTSRKEWLRLKDHLRTSAQTEQRLITSNLLPRLLLLQSELIDAEEPRRSLESDRRGAWAECSREHVARIRVSSAVTTSRFSSRQIGSPAIRICRELLSGTRRLTSLSFSRITRESLKRITKSRPMFV